jgi:hypothetical protein
VSQALSFTWQPTHVGTQFLGDRSQCFQALADGSLPCGGRGE